MACNPDWEHAAFSLYRFKPSVAGNVAFIALFGLSTIMHAVQVYRTRSWYLSALVIGGLCEVIGYFGRLMGALEDPGCWTLGPYIMQSLLILIAPALMAASIYMILGRIIILTDSERYSPLRLKWLTKIFVFGDVLSLLLQSSGGGMMAISSMAKMGEKVVVIGLFVQLIFFGCFVAVAVIVHRRLSQYPIPRAADPRIRWRLYLLTLYVASVLITIRNVFRVIEFIDGHDGPLMSSEVYVFVFDGALMLITLAWMNWFHPSEIGLLLRGCEPLKNGFELMKGGREWETKHRVGSMESLRSARV